MAYCINHLLDFLRMVFLLTAKSIQSEEKVSFCEFNG